MADTKEPKQARRITYSEPQEPTIPVPAEVTPESYAHAKATTPPDIWESYSAHWDKALEATAGRTKAAKEAKAVEAGSAPSGAPVVEAPAPEAEQSAAPKKK